MLDREEISICIPTRNRPEFLCEAVQSCLVQTYRSLEILISDDSDDEASERALGALSISDRVRLRYWRNTPPLGQAGNVNRLFDSASASRLVIFQRRQRLLMADFCL